MKQIKYEGRKVVVIATKKELMQIHIVSISIEGETGEIIIKKHENWFAVKVNGRTWNIKGYMLRYTNGKKII